MEVSLAAAGPAAPGVAWQRYADTRLWATWSPQITGVVLDAPGYELSDVERLATGEQPATDDRAQDIDGAPTA